MKDKCRGKIIAKFVGLRAKTYSYLIDDGRRWEKRGTKKCIIKGKHKFGNYEKFLEAIEVENKISYLGNNKIDIDNIKKVIKNS